MSCFYKEEGKTWQAGLAGGEEAQRSVSHGGRHDWWPLQSVGFQLLCVKNSTWTDSMEFT